MTIILATNIMQEHFYNYIQKIDIKVTKAVYNTLI